MGAMESSWNLDAAVYFSTQSPFEANLHCMAQTKIKTKLVAGVVTLMVLGIAAVIMSSIGISSSRH